MNKTLWGKGRQDYRRLLNIKLSKKNNFVSFFFGLLFTAPIIFPPACFLFQIIMIYWYNKRAMDFFLAIAWALLMIANGLSNYITVLMIKANDREFTEVNQLDDKAIWLYQTLNPGFGFVMLLVMFFFGFSARYMG